jgi:hypothetical protein
MTVDWFRRRVLFGGLLTVVPLSVCPRCAKAQEYSGCWIDESSTHTFLNNHQSGQSLGAEVLVSKSGIDDLEGALVETLDMLSVMFGILPGFSYYRENDAPNAKATSHNFMKNRSDGTVLFGLKLLKNLLDLPVYRDTAIVAVCAHEFAHILSYSNGMIAQLSPPGNKSPLRSEQFADYMAGYFAGRRKLVKSNFHAEAFAVTTGMYGGGTHGTSKQREDAVKEGFLTAYYRKLEPQLASQRALTFALAGPG